MNERFLYLGACMDRITMSEKHRRSLRKQRPILEVGLQVVQLLPFMTDILLPEDEESIIAEKTKTDQVRALLDILPRKGPEAFGCFVDSLWEVQPPLARALGLEDLELDEEHPELLVPALPNFTRLPRLLIGVEGRVLQDVFDAIHPPATLNAVLCSGPVHSKLQNLKSRRILSIYQWDILYPGYGESVTSANFDITLLFLLLRHICSLAPPATGWFRPPPPLDLSMQADLVRIKHSRNERYTNRSYLTISDTDFETKWNDIKGALTRLGGSKYEAELQQLRIESMDAECENDKKPETVPPEILARGPQAQSAYKQALKSGKVKNPCLPVVLVGQSRSGKTSLLRSLNGEKFNSSEDSTVGAELQRSLSTADGDWEKNENNENMLYNHCAAMIVTKDLKKPAQTNPDNADDINSLWNNQKEYSTQEESAQNNTTALLVDQEDNNTTQNVDNVENLDHFDKQELIPDEVAMYTEHMLENPDNEKQMQNYLFFQTMDFAGQPVYSVTHPVFLPPKGVYLLVHSLENDLHAPATPIVKTGAVAEKIDHDPMTNMGHLKFWLSLIDANSPQEGGSPVFVVSTHADKHLKAEVEKTARKILDTLREESFAPGRHVVHEIYTVDNTVSGSSSPEDAGIKELKTQICKKAKSLPQMNEDIPIRWLLFQNKLEHLARDEKRRHISFQEAEIIALQCEVDISSDELDTLLNYLHDLKVIIHFPETGMIIIDTQWLLDMFSKVITVQPREYHEGYENEWRKLEYQGIIDVKFLGHLWKDLLNNDTSVESLITIMERFSLVCKQRDGSFLVPAMLSNSTIDETHELVTSVDCASPLVVRFKSSYLPLGLFPRLLVAVDEMCNLTWKSSTLPHLSRNFARFYIQSDDDNEFSLVFMADTATIAVALIDDVNPGRRDDVYVQQCRFILEFLSETLEKMVTSFTWMKRLTQFDFCIRCPICPTSCKDHDKNHCYRDSCVHLVSEKELLKAKKPRCQKNPTKPNVIPDTSYSHWFPRTKSQCKEEKEDVKNTPEASCLSSRKDGDNKGTDIVPLLNLMSSMSMDEATDKAKKIADHLKLDKNSVEDPPDDTKRMCRKFCKKMIGGEQTNCVQALRNELPSGMTGPLQFTHDLLVKDMDLKIKENLSKALTVRKMEWKIFAKEEVNLSADEIEFLDERKSNPVLEILNDHCGDWSVDELYTAIVDCGANAIADRCL